MKYLSGTALGICALALAFTAMPVHAETATSTSALTSQLQALLKQVADLQAQMEKLNKQRAELTRDIITTRIALTKNLREGMTDDEVKVLQELLAMDSTIYPEGLVTGYFGPLTTKALKRFQEKHGIEAVGEVGPKTLAKLNEEVSKGAWKAGNLPPGIAKKFSSSTAEMLPPGIYKKFIEQFWSKKAEGKDDDEDEDDDDDNATSTLSIEDVEVDETGATTARIKWHTDVKSTGTLFYGTDDSLDTDATTTLKKTSSSKKSHDIRLTGLEEDETYYFVIVAEAGDDEVESDEMSFVMDGEDDEDSDDEDDDDDDDEDEDDDD